MTDMETLSSQIITPPPPESPGLPDTLSDVLSLDYIDGIDYTQYQERSQNHSLTSTEQAVFEAFTKSGVTVII